MKTISLTEEQWEILENELISLSFYHHNDDSVHINDCGSKILFVLQEQIRNQNITQKTPINSLTTS